MKKPNSRRGCSTWIQSEKCRFLDSWLKFSYIKKGVKLTPGKKHVCLNRESHIGESQNAFRIVKPCRIILGVGAGTSNGSEVPFLAYPIYNWVITPATHQLRSLWSSKYFGGLDPRPRSVPPVQTLKLPEIQPPHQHVWFTYLDIIPTKKTGS